MKQELVRINSIDMIEQPGILYSPNNDTSKIVIHVHGLNGNFYENRFIDTLAKSYTDNNYAFLTFNNRGRDVITELLKGDGFTVIGGSLERFKDCILDIDGVVNWVIEKGYNEIILEGHSYGCNKVLYYYNYRKSDYFKKIVLLAPCDIPSEGKKFLNKEEYEKAKNDSTRLVQEGKENDLRYVDGENGRSELLNSIEIPVLVIFGDMDECVLTQPIEVVKKYLTNNLRDCNIQIINGADHLYAGKYDELGKIIKRRMK